MCHLWAIERKQHSHEQRKRKESVYPISTHAPRVGSDSGWPVTPRPRTSFNPRSPCGERPRPSSRAARRFCFSPRSPCGERLRGVARRSQGKRVSAHAPRVGSDDFPRQLPLVLDVSTHAPRVGSDCGLGGEHDGVDVSTHAPRVGSDDGVAVLHHASFVSTHAPRVGSDCTCQAHAQFALRVSTHAPRVGSDRVVTAIARPLSGFNPRSPCGERPRSVSGCYWSSGFNPRSPCGERPVSSTCPSRLTRFQPTLPVWGATA